VKWKVFTTSYRKVRQETAIVEGPVVLEWDLKDRKGVRVANGTYYVLFEGVGESILRRVLILR